MIYPSYGSPSVQVTEVVSDPSAPAAGDVWIKTIGQVGTAGQAMGVLGLTYSRTEVNKYYLSFKTDNGDIKRIELT